MHHYIACDLGAESGRVMLGVLEGGKLRLEEIHRFANAPLRIMGSLRWDLLRIYHEIKTGLRMIAEHGIREGSVSVDAWGVDYAWYNGVHPLLAPAYHYRDGRTEQTYCLVRERLSEELIFSETGIQFMPINTLYQLASDVKQSSGLLAAAKGFLMVGDFFNYLLSGVARTEVSSASTTQIYNPRKQGWSEEIIHRGGLPASLFTQIIPSGTVLGPVLEEISRETGLSNVHVVATCSHDTGAAVAAVPAAEGEDWAFLSSGTWSLLGVELRSPLINADVQARNFTNEIGYGGTVRFLKNIVGLWLLQECRNAWLQAGQSSDYATLTSQAGEAEPFRSLIRPDAVVFAQTGDMPQKIAAFCRKTAQPEPETPGQFARCILESLALLYQTTMQELETLTGRVIQRLHVVGGGSQSILLNQFTANAIGKETLAGPVEATAIGNTLLQAVSLGHLSSLDALRATVRRSFPITTFTPRDAAAWQEAHARFTELAVAI